MRHRRSGHRERSGAGRWSGYLPAVLIGLIVPAWAAGRAGGPGSVLDDESLENMESAGAGYELLSGESIDNEQEMVGGGFTLLGRYDVEPSSLRRVAGDEELSEASIWADEGVELWVEGE